MYKPENDDFRIKMCTEVNLEDLVTIHHEMGHIQYYIQYRDKPLEFRKGANNGKHSWIFKTHNLQTDLTLIFSVSCQNVFPQLRNNYFLGFHEAIGDTMALSVMTPVHMETIGLLDNYQQSTQADINYLLNAAMKKVSGNKVYIFFYVQSKYQITQ